MNQILSQNEVDALLSAVSDGLLDSEEGEGAQVEEQDITPYDLRNQDKVIRGRMPTLEIIYELFIRLFRVSLSNALRKIASISIISTDLLKFGEFINTLPIPSCMGIIRFESLRGPGLIVLESKLAYALIDSFFGGTDRPFTKIEGKEFTNIEMSIVKKCIDLAIRDLEEAWEPVHPTKIIYVRPEVNPQFAGIVPPQDVIISTTFEVELENATGTMALVMPYATIEPIKQKLNQSFQTEVDKEDRSWAIALGEHLKDTEAELTVKLGESDIDVGDLINLNIGDVIPLGQDAGGELTMLCEGVPKFKCVFGVSRGNRAVQVTKHIKNIG